MSVVLMAALSVEQWVGLKVVS
jgi:hypothetical protein